MTRSVVLLPSVQRNHGLNGYVEGEGMHVVGERARDLLSRAPGFSVRLIWPGLESGPGYPLLRQQQREAAEWLRGQPGPYEDKIVLNLHSDSGATSHVFGLYGVAADGVRRQSYRLAAAVAPAVARRMSIGYVRVVTRLGDMDFSKYIFYAEQEFISALVECGSHENAHDVRVLTGSPDAVARGIIEGIQAYFGVKPPKGAKPGVVWRRGAFIVTAPGAIARSAPSRAGRVLRPLGPEVYATDGYTDGGQRVAGSSRWYHIARESGYGWVHSSAGRYTECKEVLGEREVRS